MTNDDSLKLPWIKSENRLPEFNRLVVAFLAGSKTHSGFNWERSGFAFMVRHDDAIHTVLDGWSRKHYEDALKRIDAEEAMVTHWIPLEAPDVRG